MVLTLEQLKSISEYLVLVLPLHIEHKRLTATKEYPTTIALLNNYATIKFSTDKVASHKFYKAFADFVMALKVNEYSGDYLGTNSELEQLYWSYYDAAAKEVRDVPKESWAFSAMDWASLFDCCAKGVDHCDYSIGKTLPRIRSGLLRE